METGNYTFEYDGREICPCESLPEILKPVKDFKALCDEYGVELEELYGNVSKMLDDQFISTASESRIATYEKQLNVIPKATDTLDERRFRVLALLNDKPPYTDRYMTDKLYELCGHTGWGQFRDYFNYKLTIEVSNESISNVETIMKFLRSIVPANMDLTVQEYRGRHYMYYSFRHKDITYALYTHDDLKYRTMFK